MNKKRSSFLYIFLVLFFFTQCCDAQTTNSFGISAAELNVITAEVTAHEVENTKKAPLTESLYIMAESLFELSILPQEGQTVTVVFKVSVPHKKPRIIFEPTFFGNEGRVSLAPSSRLVFSGDGIIEVRNGVTFDLSSAQMVLEKGAILQIVPDATVTFVNHKSVKKLSIESEEITGNVSQADIADQKTDISHGRSQKIENNATEQKRAVAMLKNQATVFADPGQLILRKGGQILLDNPSHLIFGSCSADNIMLKAEFGGQFIVDNKDALVSFQRGTFDIFFNNFSILQILAGTVELNTCKGLASPGLIRTWYFQTGAMLEIKNNNHGLGILSLAANNSEQQYKETNFDNQTSFTRGSGNLQFKVFNDDGDVTVDSTVQLQPHSFEQKGSMLNLFMSLACIDAPGTKEVARGVKLAKQGNILDSMPGQLAAFGPSGDGSVVPLLSGDHKMFYDSNEPGGPLNVIRGYDARNKLFVIDDGRRYS